ncbi:Regulatory protein RecX [Apilactobacillus kunkeei]|uniref:recombination regulator RecX n=1 Tax=Apilactobacillus kunkeei TaxID=148814 RepID=UPI0006CE87E3|nr:recombination regulator RecX [Apilactobacillus kunkeei]KPN80798.1 Regulatory protein RecX [Apilactobacillus kunkeei]
MASKITMIEAQKRKGRFNVYVDGVYAFPISENVMIKYRIFKGMEIDDELKQELVNADDISKLYSKAINFLSHQLRTENEVVKKLQTYSENEQHIAAVMQKLVELKLVNDQSYADSYVRTEVKKQDKGPSNVFYKLKEKQINENLIENALNNFYSHKEMIENCQIQADKIFKKHKRDAFKNRLDKTKLALMKKGYPTDVVLSVMEDMDFQVDEEDQMDLLRQQGDKIWHRNRKYDGMQRVMKTKQALYRKGFDMDDINSFIDDKNMDE